MVTNVITPTTTEQRQVLMLAGFVHVTGLTESGPTKGQTHRIEVESPSWIGHYDTNNGKVVIVTMGAEVWLAVGTKKPYEFFRSELGRELCPRGRGAYVPCSNLEQLDFTDVLHRLADPDWEPTR